jgi:hypothetical protein
MAAVAREFLFEKIKKDWTENTEGDCKENKTRDQSNDNFFINKHKNIVSLTKRLIKKFGENHV